MTAVPPSVDKRFLTYYITTAVMDYFRFQRRCTFIASEIGVYNSDVLCINNKDTIIEIEVKTNIRDMRNDLKKAYKKYGQTYKKHEVYANTKTRSIWVPHLFYFAVPCQMLEEAISFVEEKSPKSGVITVSTDNLSDTRMIGLCTIVKKAKQLHRRPVPDKLRYSLIMRMGSELITNRQRIIKYKELMGKC